MMITESATAFVAMSKTPPPAATPRRKYQQILHFRDAFTASVELADLESALGLPASATTYQLGQLNSRIKMLRAELARRDSPPPAPTPPSAKPPPQSLPPAPTPPSAKPPPQSLPPAPPVAAVPSVAKPDFSHLTGFSRACAVHKFEEQRKALPAASKPDLSHLEGLSKACAAHNHQRRENKIAQLRAQLPKVKGLALAALQAKITALETEPLEKP